MKKAGFSALLFVYCCFCLGFEIMAQGQIQGRILESGASGAAFATVTLLNAADSSMAKGAITDENGIFLLQQVSSGSYLLSVSSVGFMPYVGSPFGFNANQTPLKMKEIILSQTELGLDEVVVSAQRPVVERKSDRFVMDVTASSFQAENLLDIFRALPFVQVQGEGISINGKAGILIVLDNVQMPGATMSSILETMTGDEIENIEFITNPSSRYPSNINSVIKITTKKSKNYGLSGTARTTLSQGRRFRSSTGVQLTYRKEKWLVDLNLTYGLQDWLFTREGHRLFAVDGTEMAISESSEGSTLSGRLGLRGRFEYYLNKNHKIGFQNFNSLRSIQEGSFNRQTLRFSERPHQSPDSLLVSHMVNSGHRTSENYSFYYSGQLDSLGKQLDVVFTYSPLAVDELDVMRQQDIISPEGQVLTPLRRFRNRNVSNAEILVTQVDLDLPFHNGWQATAGTKLAFSTNNTRPTQELLTPTGYVVDEAFTFSNNFEENILAAYGNVNKSFGKTQLSAGLRMEHSTMLVRDLKTQTEIVNRKLTDFFPTFQLTRPMSEHWVLSANYRETINRPGFNSLTPFQVYVDDYTNVSGNPRLRPQYNRSFSVNSVIKNNLFVELEYQKQVDASTNLPVFNNGAFVLSPTNFNLDYYSTTINYSFDFTNWWSGSVFGMGAIYNGEIYEQAFENLSIPRSFFQTYGFNNTISLPKGMSLDLAYSIQEPFDYGLVRTVRSQYTRIALKGNLLDNNLQYVISGLDLFRTSFDGGEVTSYNGFLRSREYHDARRVQLGLVYKFGKKTVKGANSQKLGNEDVINRAN
ncbi:outer membrane beta-barrel family protein [Litoribacter populi]|uniref:outer membrane beta-barrel family protein n=1 Tax=Litoribacter populi TaxID=2598460 RepID=UPI0011809956|nr:outer membrane beta-barrel protein [Litoribacter populi]